jgi:hypothetical protein
MLFSKMTRAEVEEMMVNFGLEAEAVLAVARADAPRRASERRQEILAAAEKKGLLPQELWGMAIIELNGVGGPQGRGMGCYQIMPDKHDLVEMRHFRTNRTRFFSRFGKGRRHGSDGIAWDCDILEIAHTIYMPGWHIVPAADDIFSLAVRDGEGKETILRGIPEEWAQSWARNRLYWSTQEGPMEAVLLWGAFLGDLQDRRREVEFAQDRANNTTTRVLAHDGPTNQVGAIETAPVEKLVVGERMAFRIPRIGWGVIETVPFQSTFTSDYYEDINNVLSSAGFFLEAGCTAGFLLEAGCTEKACDQPCERCDLKDWWVVRSAS